MALSPSIRGGFFWIFYGLCLFACLIIRSLEVFEMHVV